MKHVNYLSFFLLTLFSISFISCSDDDDNKLNTGITNQSWTEGKSLGISQDNELSVSFNAAAKWVASVTSGADWCKLNTTSGTKGQSTLKLSVSTSSTTDRTARISINIDGYSPASFEVTQKGTSVPQTTEDMEINAKVDEYLREMYLWNDEYKTLNLDHNKGYEDFFYDALGSMTTNTLDKKTYVGSDGKTYYNLFSYIQLLPNISSTRTTKIVNKELAYSFGITGITPISIGTQAENTIYFCLQGVYPDSPASEAGLKRGAMISLINGKKINNNNINNFYYDILSPDATINYTLTEDVVEGGTITGQKEYTITSKATYNNPVIISLINGKKINNNNINNFYYDILSPDATINYTLTEDVVEGGTITGQKEYTITSKATYNNPVIFSNVKEDIEGHRIGYLVYSGFEAGFDQELFNVFKDFKNKNVTDLILDLRYNGGGHTMSANLIATCIAGTASQGKVFSSLRYNDERMAKLNNKREDELFAYSSYPNLGTSLSAGSLNLPRVYCLVGNGTASASELVINSLEGIDLDVILIGEKTTGKNVGMEYEEYTVRNNTYRVVPITFQSYNAKGFGEYEKGFEPDILMDETNPYNEQGVFYIHKDYGNNEEPLYAKAIELITGTNPAPQTRSAVVNTLDGKTYKLPAIFRPGHDGMLMPARHAE